MFDSVGAVATLPPGPPPAFVEYTPPQSLLLLLMG